MFLFCRLHYLGKLFLFYLVITGEIVMWIKTFKVSGQTIVGKFILRWNNICPNLIQASYFFNRQQLINIHSVILTFLLLFSSFLLSHFFFSYVLNHSWDKNVLLGAFPNSFFLFRHFFILIFLCKDFLSFKI